LLALFLKNSIINLMLMELEQPKNNLFYLLPRGLSIAFIVFCGLFALVVFNNSTFTLKELLFALFLHLTPSFVLLLALLIAWRFEVLGGIIFIAFGIAYALFGWGRIPFNAFFLISGSLVAIGILFILGNFLKKKKRTKAA
jgi:hypothetical protein